MAPLEMIESYSADAVRYWAASTGFGKDAIISEEKVQMGTKLVTKLWNVARFSQRFLSGATPSDTAPDTAPDADALSPADRWILARVQRLIGRVTDLFQGYDYAAAKSETEIFFWHDLADNYLEMAKLRLYSETGAAGAGARYALHQALLTTLKLLAPFLPHVTDEIYRAMFADSDGASSIHRARWPVPQPHLADEDAAAWGEALVAVATAVRRYKSEHNLSLGTELARLQLATEDAEMAKWLRAATPDLQSVTRAAHIEIIEGLPALSDDLETVAADGAPPIALRVKA
jgi:valyl-tRNA synthetase